MPAMWKGLSAGAAPRMTMRAGIAAASILALASQGPAAAQVPPPPLPRGLFGDVGLINMPSARMADDGELYISTDFFENTQHYDAGFQILPWLAGSFRCSGLQDFLPGTGTPVYFDRSFALKARLWNESDFLPAVSVGISDLVGTGVYGGEYVVASKQFGSLDASLGFGWGRLSTNKGFRNPLGALSSSFYNRAARPLDYGGQFSFSSYFHGPQAALFGGVSWRTPLSGLTLIAEYSSDAYVAEAKVGSFKPQNQFNFGADYKVMDNISLGLGWLYGETMYGTLTVTLDPVHPQYTASLGPAMPPVVVRTPEQQQMALSTLLQTNDPVRNQDHQQRLARQSQFVDLLFRSGFSDVKMEGQEMVLVGREAPSAAACQRYAQISRAYEGNIAAISMVSETQAFRSVRCGVPGAAARPLFANTSGTARLTNASVLTIDGASTVLDSAGMAAASRKIRTALVAQRINPEAINLGVTQATVYYSNHTYTTESEAVTRILRVLMADAPPQIERFKLVAISAGVPQQAMEAMRTPLERGMAADQDMVTIAQESVAINPAPLNNPILRAADRGTYPRLNWSISPQFRQALFDPYNPFGVQFVAAGTVGVEVARGLALNLEAEANLYNTYSIRIGPSALPPVRTSFGRYFLEGKNGIGDLEGSYRVRLAPNIFAVARAGYLESMFAGVGGEILWRPDHQRWALGIDGYEVQQRGFDRLLDLQHYRIATGHVSLYYQSPWYGLDLTLRAGQYLAGDRGMTVEISRRFRTGVEIGVFATKTNVPTATFGEGSFDNGIVIRIPLSWGLPITTQTEFNTIIRPIQRDGGQRLLGDTILWDETQRASESEIADHFADVH